MNSTPHLGTLHTRKHCFPCASSAAHASQPALFCVISQNSHLHRHGSCRTRNVHCLTAFPFHLRTALRPTLSSEREYPQQSATWRSVWPSCRTEPNHTLYLANADIKTVFDVVRQKLFAKIMGEQDVHGWITAAFLREVTGLEGQATFEHVEGTFRF